MEMAFFVIINELLRDKVKSNANEKYGEDLEKMKVEISGRDGRN